MRLILFDVDGTLVDSQASIVAAMTTAFDANGLAPPARADILSIVGLSLAQAVFRLAPGTNAEVQEKLVATYKAAFHAARVSGARPVPLYQGVRELLDRLAGEADTLLGVATGKSRRGLDALLAEHDLAEMFITRQVADDHPSKPNPAMIEAAMAETGCARADTVMIGDTTFDMDMACAAGVAPVAVAWGYHPEPALRARTEHVASDVEALAGMLDLLRRAAA